MASEKKNNTEIKKWVIESETDLLNTPVFRIQKRHCRPPDNGEDGDFFIINAPNWVNVIARTDAGNLILIRQYRFGIDDISLEIPGGVVDPGDDNPLETAKRELREETGFISENWKLLGKVSSNPAIFTNYCYVYQADNCIFEHEQDLDAHERIEVVKMNISEVKEAFRNGRIHHSLVVAAFAQYLLRDC